MYLVAQPCLTLYNLMDCSPPGSSVHGDSAGRNTGEGCHALLQGIFPTQGLKPGLPHCRWILYLLSDQQSPKLQATQPNLNPISAHPISFSYNSLCFCFFHDPFLLDLCFLLTLIILGLPLLVLFTTISK